MGSPAIFKVRDLSNQLRAEVSLISASIMVEAISSNNISVDLNDISSPGADVTSAPADSSGSVMWLSVRFVPIQTLT